MFSYETALEGGALHGPHSASANPPGGHAPRYSPTEQDVLVHARHPSREAEGKLPGGQEEHVAALEAPTSSEWLPSGHEVHVAALSACKAGEYVPAGHGVHVTA